MTAKTLLRSDCAPGFPTKNPFWGPKELYLRPGDRVKMCKCNISKTLDHADSIPGFWRMTSKNTLPKSTARRNVVYVPRRALAYTEPWVMPARQIVWLVVGARGRNVWAPAATPRLRLVRGPFAGSAPVGNPALYYLLGDSRPAGMALYTRGGGLPHAGSNVPSGPTKLP